MRVLQTPRDFLGMVGEKLGTSGWFTITQEHISDFARVTGDDFWIHVDTERAAREMPGGKTIAHGIFTLSLVPLLQRDIFRIEQRGRGLNYGSNKVRYTAPVPVGSRVRLHQTLASAERGPAPSAGQRRARARPRASSRAASSRSRAASARRWSPNSSCTSKTRPPDAFGHSHYQGDRT